MGTRVGLVAVVGVLLAAIGCTVKQSEVPPMSGPSELALALSLTATPDSLSLDGSQAALVVEARNAAGAPQAGVPIRLDIYVGGTAQDCGTLSTRSVVTGSNGRPPVSPVYTAPSVPLPLPQCANFTPGSAVTILAVPTGSNFDTVSARSATIRLLQPGVILPPVSFVPNFTIAPAATTAGTATTFDASSSTDPNTLIASYAWGFGDGSTGSGRIVTHAYTSVGVYSVTLTVADAAGRAASTTKTVTVGAGTAPTASFSFSPATIRSGDTVFFTAAGSAAAAGRTIVSYQWDFGDGTAKNLSAASTTHDFIAATGNTFSVSLVVVDDIGQRSAVSKTTVVVLP